jgi:hypothetical protein
MKMLARTLVTTAMVLACLGISFGQGERAPSPIAPQHIDEPREPVSSKYEKSKDLTVVQLNPVLVSDEEYFASAYLLTVHNLFMQAYFTYPGKTPQTPPSVVLTFVSLKHAQRYYQKERNLSFIVDGAPLEIGKTQVVQFQAMQDNVLKEILAIEVHYEKLKRIANAKKVKMKLGQTEWDLKKKHLKALHDFVGRAQPKE